MHPYLQIMEKAQSYVAQVKVRVETPEQVANLVRPLCDMCEQENMLVLILNTKHGVISIESISTGTVDRSQTHARDVFREAIRKNATRLILVHNHPSGDSTPSAQDVQITKGLQEAGKIVGIELLDHIVIGAKTLTHCGYTSLREANLMGVP
jgi:DNA repair protein RadC